MAMVGEDVLLRVSERRARRRRRGERVKAGCVGEGRRGKRREHEIVRTGTPPSDAYQRKKKRKKKKKSRPKSQQNRKNKKVKKALVQQGTQQIIRASKLKQKKSGEREEEKNFKKKLKRKAGSHSYLVYPPISASVPVSSRSKYS